jgi:hypothetical protein
MIKTGPHLKQAREALGWSPAELARALRLSGGPEQGEKRVLEMEAGKRQLSGPVAVSVESFLHGFKPLGFKTDDAMIDPPKSTKKMPPNPEGQARRAAAAAAPRRA